MLVNDLMRKPTSLNEQQLEMLCLLKVPIPAEDYDEVKRMVVKSLARNIDSGTGNVMEEIEWITEIHEFWNRENAASRYVNTGIY